MMENQIKTADVLTVNDKPEKLKRLEEKLTNILEGTNAGIWEWNLQTQELEINERWATIIGYTLEELLPITIETWKKFSHPEDLKNAQDELNRAFSKEKPYYDIDFRMKHKDGRWIWVNSRGVVNSWSKDNKPIMISGIHMDITKYKELELNLANEKKLFEATLTSVGEGVISCDNNGLVTFSNLIAERLTGFTQDNAIGKPLEEVFHIVHEDTGEKSENIASKVLENGRINEMVNHTILISEDGSRKPLEYCAAPIIQDDGEIIGVVIVFSDCSDKKEKIKQIQYLSYHDYLTGLYNRRFFEEELKRYDTTRSLPMTIVMGDINGLKLINDSFGHNVGNELLKKVAEIIMKECRSEDVVARLGGDEFVIILPRTDEPEANILLKRIQDSLSRQRVGAIALSVSFGLETRKSQKVSIRDVLKNAENHLHRNKLYESASIRSETINLIINTLYEKNHREMLHSKRVSEICVLIAKSMNHDNDFINQIRIAGLMHDIGKIGIEENILNKEGKLDDQEWIEIKKHCEIGHRILSSVNEYSEIAEFVLQHEERWDGTGYPKGLKGDQISLQARIISLADSYDAMTGRRTYKERASKQEAIEELCRCSGTQFDSEIVKIFIEKVAGGLRNLSDEILI